VDSWFSLITGNDIKTKIVVVEINTTIYNKEITSKTNNIDFEINKRIDKAGIGSLLECDGWVKRWIETIASSSMGVI
jgi:hypothetical protein